MLQYRDRTLKAKEIAVHYADQLADETMAAIVAGEREIKSKEEAVALCEFFWAMADQAALDTEKGVVIADEHNVQFWIEKLYNIIHGHLDSIGYLEQWEEVCDRQ